MAAIQDPHSGLQFHELSHPWGYNTPTQPGFEDVKIDRLTYHAKFGVMTQRISMVMHSSTHMNAPIHLVQRAPYVGELAPDIFFGGGVVWDLPKGEWDLIEPADLEAASPAMETGDIVLINTGWHHKYSDSQEYFGHGPGLSLAAAEWLVEKGAKLVGVDTAFIDHPLATSMGPHRGGPQIKYLMPRYKEKTGREASDDFPHWNPAHKALLGAGIPTIENVGGDLDDVTAMRCTLQSYPWRWKEGDACVVRLVAIHDPAGTYRLEDGR